MTIEGGGNFLTNFGEFSQVYYDTWFIPDLNQFLGVNCYVIIDKWLHTMYAIFGSNRLRP